MGRLSCKSDQSIYRCRACLVSLRKELYTAANLSTPARTLDVEYPSPAYWSVNHRRLPAPAPPTITDTPTTAMAYPRSSPYRLRLFGWPGGPALRRTPLQQSERHVSTRRLGDSAARKHHEPTRLPSDGLAPNLFQETPRRVMMAAGNDLEVRHRS